MGSVSWSPGGLFLACVLKRGPLVVTNLGMVLVSLLTSQRAESNSINRPTCNNKLEHTLSSCYCHVTAKNHRRVAKTNAFICSHFMSPLVRSPLTSTPPEHFNTFKLDFFLPPRTLKHPQNQQRAIKDAVYRLVHLHNVAPQSHVPKRRLRKQVFYCDLNNQHCRNKRFAVTPGFSGISFSAHEVLFYEV